MPLVFVYGTLKRGQVNHAPWMTVVSTPAAEPTGVEVRRACRFVSVARTVQRYPFFINSPEFGWSPCVLNLPDDAECGTVVAGELYDVCEEHLERHLDALEGVSTGVYSKDIVRVRQVGSARKRDEGGAAHDIEALIYFRTSRFPTGPEGAEPWRDPAVCANLAANSGWFDVVWCVAHIPGYHYLAPHLREPHPQQLCASNGNDNDNDNDNDNGNGTAAVVAALVPPVVPPPIALIIIDGAGDNARPLAELREAFAPPDARASSALDAFEAAAVGCGTASLRLTPLEYAAVLSPGLSAVAAHGRSGLMDPVRSGLACGSDTAHLAMFGYDPRVYYRGRGAFESIGAGMDMGPSDIAFKCNFATLDEGSGVVLHRRCDRNFAVEGPVLCAALDGLVLGPGAEASPIVASVAAAQVKGGAEGRQQEREQEGGTAALLSWLRETHTIRVRYATEHRCGVVITGATLSDRITGTDPLADGRPLLRCAVSPAIAADGDEEERECAEYTARVVELASQVMCAVLRQHPINVARAAEGRPAANIVLLRGAASRGAVPPFAVLHGLRGCILAPTCIIRGLGRTCGLDVVECEGATGDYHSDYRAKAAAFADALFSHDHRRHDRRYDFGVLHVKGVDDAGHDRDLRMKIKLLVDVGVMIERVWDAAPPGTTIAVTADHSTPVIIGDHSCEPVALAVATKSRDGAAAARDGVSLLSEQRAAAHGVLGCLRGGDLMRTLIRVHHDACSQWPREVG